ncbi:MAG: DUF2461 domain-containing protein [Bacteroidota bacterium]|nr:DUF2461 domain-containing protein [Bacteroidota bacterium]
MIQKPTLAFLTKIKKNNNREWFEKNKELYIAAKEDVENNIEEIINGIRKFDKRIPADLSAKKCVFRIYRDVRFSKDKKPYKNNLGASINPGGKKDVSPGYYIHVQPGAAFVAGGMWMPEAPNLNKIRQEIDYNLSDFLKIINDKTFKKTFGKLSIEDSLVNAPKGYPKDHKAAEFLKLKSFIVVANLKDADLLGKNYEKKVIEICKAMQPLNNFLQRAID